VNGSRNKGIDWDREPLGLVTDRELAEKHGVNRETVSDVRRRRGIPAFCTKIRKPRWRNQEIDWAKLPLGQLPDAEVGRRHGVPREVVYYNRRRLKIPYDPSKTVILYLTHGELAWLTRLMDGMLRGSPPTVDEVRRREFGAVRAAIASVAKREKRRDDEVPG
jgi:hypothetical protein